MSKIKMVIYIIIFLLLIAGGLIIGVQHSKIESNRAEIERVSNNYEAIQRGSDILAKSNLEYKLTIENLEQSKDSIDVELNKVRKQLKIKDKELQELAYIASTAKRTDTLILIDSIFIKDTKVDTTIKDNWYTLDLTLESPNKIIVSPEFKSEKSIITYSRKEIINPSKCWFVNLFKKRATYIEVEVEEKSPYIVKDKEKFISIVK